MVKSFHIIDKVLNISAERYLRTAGNLFIYDGDYDSALAMVEKTLEIDPQDVRALVLRGDILYCLNQDLQALHMFNRVLEINPLFVEAHLSKASVLDILGKPREALACCNLAFALMDRHREYLLPSLYDQKISLLVGLRKYRQAEALLLDASQKLEAHSYEYLLGCYRGIIDQRCKARTVMLTHAKHLGMAVLN